MEGEHGAEGLRPYQRAIPRKHEEQTFSWQVRPKAHDGVTGPEGFFLMNEKKPLVGKGGLHIAPVGPSGHQKNPLRAQREGG
jgi:hypothetical protein